MSGPGTRCLWLTALAAASLTLATGCQATPTAHHRVRQTTPPPSSATTPPPVRATVPPLPSPSPPAPAHPTSLPAVALPHDPGVLVTSDGTSTVYVGRRPVTFPGPVHDAAVSPNGTEIAYVDGAGNIATARLAGTLVTVLTSTHPGVRRAHPTFEDGGSEIIFTERGTDGVWRLKEVAADGHDGLASGGPDPTVAETRHDHGGDTAPSATRFQASPDQTARSVLVFEHRTKTGTATVFILDRNQRGPASTPLLPGSAPSISPTGDRFAFIAPDGQIAVQKLPLLNPKKAHPTQITWGAEPTGNLEWSPDGRRLVFSTARDVETVAAHPDGRRRNPVSVVVHHRGVGSFGTSLAPTVGVFAGDDPVTTALRLSRAHYANGTNAPMDEVGSFGVAVANRVVLVGADDPAAANVAAAAADGNPILFNGGHRLDPRVRTEIQRLMFPKGEGIRLRVDIVGDTSTIPAGVESQVRALGVKVGRFDPAHPAAAVAASQLSSGYGAYIVVSRTDLPAILASTGTFNPILLTDNSAMPAATARLLDQIQGSPGYPATVYAVGMQAQAAVRTSWPGKQPFRIVDIGGPDPYANSLDVVRSLYDSPGRVGVTSTSSWQDALLATEVGPSLVVDESHGLEPATRDWLAASEAALRGVYVFGGSAALPRAVGRSVFGSARFDVVRHPAQIVSSSS